ncbi:MAG: hypothetical protein HPY89_05440 [Pelotomaculum sp.]|nr:hypothetical protein [Pelotomaculum sp.]
MPAKSFGLSADDLFQIGYVRYMDTLNFFLDKIYKNKELFNNADILKGSLDSAKQEALLRTVSEMIAKNNQALLGCLMENGILPREDQ